MPPLMCRKAPTGFTLIELLVSISIITLLIAIMLPALQTARAHTLQIQCASQVRSMGQMYLLYATDNRDVLPPFERLEHYRGFRTQIPWPNSAAQAQNLAAFLRGGNGIYPTYATYAQIHYCGVDTLYTPNYLNYFNSASSPRWTYWAWLRESTDTLTSHFLMQRDYSPLHVGKVNALYGDGHTELIELLP